MSSIGQNNPQTFRLGGDSNLHGLAKFQDANENKGVWGLRDAKDQNGKAIMENGKPVKELYTRPQGGNFLTKAWNSIAFSLSSGSSKAKAATHEFLTKRVGAEQADWIMSKAKDSKGVSSDVSSYGTKKEGAEYSYLKLGSDAESKAHWEDLEQTKAANTLRNDIHSPEGTITGRVNEHLRMDPDALNREIQNLQVKHSYISDSNAVEQVLQQEMLAPVLIEFSAKGLSSENVHFLRDLVSFEKKPPTDQELTNFLNTYIGKPTDSKEDSKSQVNLMSGNSNAISVARENWESACDPARGGPDSAGAKAAKQTLLTVLLNPSGARGEINSMVAKDKFPTLTKSPEFQAAVEDQAKLNLSRKPLPATYSPASEAAKQQLAGDVNEFMEKVTELRDSSRLGRLTDRELKRDAEKLGRQIAASPHLSPGAKERLSSAVDGLTTAIDESIQLKRSGGSGTRAPGEFTERGLISDRPRTGIVTQAILTFTEVQAELNGVEPLPEPSAPPLPTTPPPEMEEKAGVEAKSEPSAPPLPRTPPPGMGE